MKNRDILLKKEAESFDRMIEERVSHGFVPDLQRAGRCEWFQNNIWRDKSLAQLFHGHILMQIQTAIQTYMPELSSNHILEVGCGPGQISLELARAGFRVTGVDVSSKCIDVARGCADNDPQKNERGSLTYMAGDIMEMTALGPYDAIVFSNSLHHFSELDALMCHLKQYLVPEGIIFASEPVRQNLTPGDAAFMHLMRELFAMHDHYYESSQLTTSVDCDDDIIHRIQQEYSYTDDGGNNTQSPLDNESNYDDMVAALELHFKPLECEFDFSFFTRIIAGIRYDNPDMEIKVAKWLKSIDILMTQYGHLTPEQFHFIGKVISHA